MKQLNLITDCENCGNEIIKRIADFTEGDGINLYLEEIEGDGFDCENCGENTSIILQKESY